VGGGVPAAAAEPFATLLIAASEGAVALSRAEQSYEPFDAVHQVLREQARGFQGG
jgi:TetR/AcrR family transcriptional regulator, lmrAB and yxaGH operons repressor